MQIHPHQAIRDALATLASTHAVIVHQMENAIDVLTTALQRDDAQHPLDSFRGPLVDRKSLSVHWHGKTCFLGNTLLFWFFERIARSPNQYVPYVDLLDEVWGAQRDNATVRGVAKRLRDKLTECGMADLARAIDGHATGYYGLKLV